MASPAVGWATRPEKVLVKYKSSEHTDTNVKKIVYPYRGPDDPEGEAEVKKAAWNEPPWAPLARELSPILIYEDMNQEFPTSIFYDGDRNMSNNGLPAKWPDDKTRPIKITDIPFVFKIINYKDRWDYL